MVANKRNARPVKRSVRARAAGAALRTGASRRTKTAKAAPAMGRRKTGKRVPAIGRVGAGLASKPLQGVPLPRTDLQRGDEGPGVRQLQRALVKLRLMTQQQMNTGPGIFGPITEAALKKFQRAHGVDAIGVYGPKTRAAFVKLGAKLGRAPKPPPSGHRNPFLSQFRRALARLRLPGSWASSEALWQLVSHESSWNPRAKNPSSTAFGLFQFLKSTWATYCKEGRYGSPDPYIQALGGFRYIKGRYKNPAGAWRFWQQHHWY